MPRQNQPQPMIGCDHIRAQAERIRDIAQRVIDACDNGTTIDPYARNKSVSGSLAGDAATLGIMIVQYEYENGEGK